MKAEWGGWDAASELSLGGLGGTAGGVASVPVSPVAWDTFARSTVGPATVAI